MQNLLDILYEQCLWNSLKYSGSTELLGTVFLPTAVDYQMIRNVGMLGISLKEKSASLYLSLASCQIHVLWHFNIILFLYPILKYF